MTDEVLDQLFKNQKTTPGTKDDIILIIDRSGSMESILNDAQGGVNTFIKEQKEVGDAYFTLVQFDWEYEKLYDQVDLRSFDEEYVLKPRGSTALLDAIGKTCGGYEPKGNGKVIVVIVTDGAENSSTEWKRSDLFDMISRKREKDGWEFIFLASGQDAIQEGTSFGFAAVDNVSYNANTRGATVAAHAFASANTTSLRTSSRKLAQEDYDLILKDIQDDDSDETDET